jgi:hypothetical protein
MTKPSPPVVASEENQSATQGPLDATSAREASRSPLNSSICAHDEQWAMATHKRPCAPPKRMSRCCRRCASSRSTPRWRSSPRGGCASEVRSTAQRLARCYSYLFVNAAVWHTVQEQLRFGPYCVPFVLERMVPEPLWKVTAPLHEAVRMVTTARLRPSHAIATQSLCASSSLTCTHECGRARQHAGAQPALAQVGNGRHFSYPSYPRGGG